MCVRCTTFVIEIPDLHEGYKNVRIQIYIGTPQSEGQQMQFAE
jgi:hypothetical protein